MYLGRAATSSDPFKLSGYLYVDGAHRIRSSAKWTSMCWRWETADSRRVSGSTNSSSSTGCGVTFLGSRRLSVRRSFFTGASILVLCPFAISRQLSRTSKWAWRIIFAFSRFQTHTLEGVTALNYCLFEGSLDLCLLVPTLQCESIDVVQEILGIELSSSSLVEECYALDAVFGKGFTKILKVGQDRNHRTQITLM